MRLGQLTVSGRKFRLPCVYEFIHDDVVTYVGCSGAGFTRVFTAYKECGPSSDDRRFKAFNEADQIRVTVFDNTEEARNEEIRLIMLHQPEGNVKHNPKAHAENKKVTK